jgi:uncharacterized protein (TIGR03435 family)
MFSAHSIACAGLNAIILSVGYAQTTGQRPTFDVVSIKPTTFPNPDSRGTVVMQRTTGGPGSSDPGRIHYPYILLKSLLLEAYTVKSLQIEGPEWLASERFEISATMPPTTTKAEFRLMLQSLLADRFHLAFHRETREVSGYSLAIAKGGPKLKESGSMPAPGAPAPPPSSGPLVLTQPKLAADGFPPQLFPPGKPGLLALRANGKARIAGQLQSTAELADFLIGFLDRPVTDGTGLTAKYDFVVDFAADSMAAPGPDGAVPDQPDALPGFFAALQSELGLRLEPKKRPLEMIVIDHIDKRPTDN